MVIAPLALLATGGWLRAVRGAGWLAYNFDPTYAYLLNSLSILRGYPPYLIQHPGVPLQTIGAVVIAARHAFGGQGSLAGDVIGRPELFVGSIYWAALAVSAVLLLAAGVMVRRRAGLGAAVLVQWAPWLSVTAVMLSGHMRAELLIVGAAPLWAAAVIACARRPSADAVAWLGAATGVLLCLHLSALPLLVAPLLLLDDHRARRRFLGWTAAAFLIAFLPALWKLPSFAKYFVMLSISSGHYASGPMTVVDTQRYLPALRQLLAIEPRATLLIAASAAVFAAGMARGARSEDERREQRALGALIATDAACYVLTAKHPDAHYLVPTLCTVGANLYLVARWIARSAPGWGRPVAATGLAAIAVSQALAITSGAAQLRGARLEQEDAARRIVAAVDERGCFLITSYPASAESQALQWGNITAEYKGRPLFGPEIAQRFPRAAFDLGGLNIQNAAWRPLDLDALLSRERCVVYAGLTRGSPGSSPRVMVEPLSTSGGEGLYRLRQVQ